jgi:nitrate/nitrite-specific signal transduction histidine kinase
MGIAIMRERAKAIGAVLKVESQPGQGTIVELSWKSRRKD